MRNVIKFLKDNKIALLIFIVSIISINYTYAFFNTDAIESSSGNENVTIYNDNGSTLKMITNKSNITKLDNTNYSSVTYSSNINFKVNELHGNRYNLNIKITENEYINLISNDAKVILKVINPDKTELTTLNSLTRVTSDGITGFDISDFVGTLNIRTNDYIETFTETTRDYEFILYVIDSKEKYNITLEVELDKIELGEVCLNEVMATCLVSNRNLEKSLIKHTPELTNSTGDSNTRYSGGDFAVKNYIEFNNELWRIIGIIDGNVKLMKDESIGKIAYHSTEDAYWEGTNLADAADNADLNKYLNGSYYNSLTSVSKTLIESEHLNVGHPGGWGSTFNEKPLAWSIVEKQVVTSNKYNISIINPSDYLFGASQNFWSLVHVDSDNPDYDYQDNPDQKHNNWVYNDSGILTINSQSNGDAWVVSGGTGRLDSTYQVSTMPFPIYPTLFLKSTIKITGGIGTIDNPYKVSL